jgi:predicted nucleic acid-binding Zn ribbon protein
MKKKEIIIAVTIAIIFALFAGYGIEVFDRTKSYSDFCPEKLYDIDEEEECLASGGSWNEFETPIVSPEKEESMIEPNKRSCSPTNECRENYDTSRSKHDKIVFIVSIIVGLMAIFTGVFLKEDPVSTGILSGGVLLIIYGTIRYWQHANDTLKFILLGIVLAVLIWISYKKLK